MQIRLRFFLAPQTVHHRSRRQLLQSMQGCLVSGLQLQAMSEAVEPVAEAEQGLEVDQTLAPPTTSTGQRGVT